MEEDSSIILPNRVNNSHTCETSLNQNDSLPNTLFDNTTAAMELTIRASYTNDTLNNCDKVFDWYATQVSDSDDDNWFVPRSSKKRIALSSHSQEKYQSWADSGKSNDLLPEPNLTDDFCEIDLKSSPTSQTKSNRTNVNTSWSKITSKLLTNYDQKRKKPSGKYTELTSAEEISQLHESYLPPFQMVGKIEDAYKDVLHNKLESKQKFLKKEKHARLSNSVNYDFKMDTAQFGNVGATESFLTSSYNDESNELSTFDSVDVHSSHPEVSKVIEDFSLAKRGDNWLEDSDSSWVIQTSSKRLVR